MLKENEQKTMARGTNSQTSMIETFIDYLRRRQAMTIFVFLCIGASLVLGGVFISKALLPVDDIATIKSTSVESTTKTSGETSAILTHTSTKMPTVIGRCFNSLKSSL